MTKTIVKTTALTLALALAGGAASASDDDPEFSARLNGAQEVPPVDTASRGRFRAELDDDKRLVVRLRVRTARHAAVALLGFAGAHIHCGDAVTNGPVIAFLAGVIPGGVDGLYRTRSELTDANVMPTDCGSNLSEVIESMIEGDTYVNVHSLANPGGEVRGQIYLDDRD